MKLSVVGLGKLGLPLAAVLASKGHDVIGIDLNVGFVEKINQGIAPFEEPGLQELLNEHSFKIQAKTSYDESLIDTEATFIIVPTPSQENGKFTNRYVLDAVEKIGESLRNKNEYHLVVITSTVMPGSSDGEIRETLEKASGKTVGQDIGLCYNPEFIALGSVVNDMLFPDMLLIGESDSKAGDLLQNIYHSVCGSDIPVQRMNLVNAELTKLSVNTYVTTKISYANMIGGLCESLPGSDADVVTKAIGLDSRIGRKYLKAAVAFGGPCFPRDNEAFKALADDLGARVDIADATRSMNKYQPERLIKIIEKNSEGARIGILGLSYKPGTYVVDESPGIKVANQLIEDGYEVSVYDPMANQTAKKTLEDAVQITNSLEECLKASDTILLMTPWPEFSEKLTPALVEELGTKLIIDCWRVISESAFTYGCKVMYIGKSYSREPLLV